MTRQAVVEGDMSDRYLTVVEKVEPELTGIHHRESEA